MTPKIRSPLNKTEGDSNGSPSRQISNSYLQSAINRGSEEMLEVYSKSAISSTGISDDVADSECACGGNCACKMGFDRTSREEETRKS